MKYFTPISGKREGLKPPELYEYFLDSFWFKASGLENEIINEPLRGRHKADVVIIGGGFTGLFKAELSPNSNNLPGVMYDTKACRWLAYPLINGL
jgi:hypothetical protein